MRPPPPDFVVAGAPKCGTTAVYATLRRHSELFLSEIKEPDYFAYDFPEHREIKTIEDYDFMFADAEDAQLRGEASTHYLGSKQAIAAILRRRPDAKIIALVRNPIDMFVSWHNQCLNVLYEDEVDPQRAWALQDERARGRRIPKHSKEPAFLQYRELCSVGTQIESLFRLVSEHQRLVILYDDFQHHPRRVYKQIVDFLGVCDDGTDRFVRENVFNRPRSEMVARVVRFATLDPRARKVGSKLRPTLHKYGIRPIHWLAQYNTKYAPKPVFSREFTRELEAAFAPDVRLLAQLLCRDLGELWSIGDGIARAAMDAPGVHTALAE